MHSIHKFLEALSWLHSLHFSSWQTNEGVVSIDCVVSIFGIEVIIFGIVVIIFGIVVIIFGIVVSIFGIVVIILLLFLV